MTERPASSTAVTAAGRYRRLWMAAGVWLVTGALPWCALVAVAIADLAVSPAQGAQLGHGAQVSAGRATAAEICLGLFAVAALPLVYRAGGISLAALGFRLRDGRRRIAGGATGVAVLYGASMFTASALESVLTNAGVFTLRVYPGSGTADPQLLAGDITGATFAGGMWEELALLAVPLALATAMPPRMTRSGRSVTPVAAVVVLLVLRCGIHLYYGWAAIGVLVWAGAAIALLKVSGTIWPLMLAHSMYDTVSFTQARVPAAGPVVTVIAVAVQAAAVAVLLTTAWRRQRTPPLAPAESIVEVI